MIKKTLLRSDSSLANQCYNQLYEDIIAGILKPGEKLRIQTLKERFFIGQSPIREALSRLVSHNLVETKENRGFWVTPISETLVRDTFTAFTEIENLLLKLAIQHGDTQWEGNILSTLHKLQQVEESKYLVDFRTWADHNYNFHVSLIAGCNSPLLLEIRDTLYIKFERYCRLSFETDLLAQDNLAKNHKEHTELAHAVLARNIKEAQRITTHHLNASFNEILINLKEKQCI